jgi:hypothetical protein
MLGGVASNRHHILSDKEFWLDLEYELSGWFQTCGVASLGGFWCDGFIPRSADNTKHGIDVQGMAWIGKGGREQYEYEFVVSIPQRMLTRRRGDIVISGVVVDPVRKRLQFAVEPKSSASGKASKDSDDASAA